MLLVPKRRSKNYALYLLLQVYTTILNLSTDLATTLRMVENWMYVSAVSSIKRSSYLRVVVGRECFENYTQVPF